MKDSSLKNVDEYIANSSDEVRPKLKQMRACIRAAAPGATQALKWGMPSFSYKRILVAYAGFKHHIGLYPTPSVTKALAKEIKNYKTGKGSIQFPLDKPLPLALIRKMVKMRVKESIGSDKRWM